MEVRDIEYFAVVAKHKSIVRAAEALGLSQPALSKSLRRLEKSVRAKVVKRTTKGVELTAVGNALLTQAERLRLTLDDISREASDLGDGRAGHLRIGTGATLAMHAVPASCDALLKEAPKVTLKVVVGDNNALLSDLREGALELVITSLRSPHHDDLIEVHLYDEPFVIFCAATHRLAKRRNLTLADLAGERWAMAPINGSTERQLHKIFGDAGLRPPDIVVETACLPLRYQLVASSGMLTFNSRRAAQYAAASVRIAILDVKGLSYNRPVGVIHRKDGYLSPAALRYIALLKIAAKDTADSKA